jgi:hypothetical protein
MLTLDQKVDIHCTDTDISAEGVIIRIRPDGFDATLQDLVISFRKHKPGIYVGQKSGMEFVVRTQN